MLWWNHQSKIKKILYGGSFLCLAAGVSTHREGIVGGTLLFLVFFTLAVFWPNRRGKTPEEKEWIYITTPHFPKRERAIHIMSDMVAIILVLFDVYFLFEALLKENILLSFICLVILLILFNSWLMMNPKYYNQIYLTKKVIPLNKEETTRAFYERVGEIKTPFGTALLGFVPSQDNEVAVFRIVDLFWVVYYYIEKTEIHINAERLEDNSINPNDTELIYKFVEELTELFCFIENTGELPDPEDLGKIFKPLEG